MFRYTHTLRRLALLSVALVLPLAACIGAGAWISRDTRAREASRREYLAARARWDARPFRDYRLVVQDGSCTYDVLVRRGQINSGYRDSCNLRARTVESLFALVGGNGTPATHCSVYGCLCETVTRVVAEYDTTLGYPRKLIMESTLRPNWLHLDLWRRFFADRNTAQCSGVNRWTINVLYVGAVADR